MMALVDSPRPNHSDDVMGLVDSPPPNQMGNMMAPVDSPCPNQSNAVMASVDSPPPNQMGNMTLPVDSPQSGNLMTGKLSSSATTCLQFSAYFPSLACAFSQSLAHA